MSANVESAVYANEPAWHREGVVLDTDGKKGLSVKQALKKGKLDWEVQKVPVYAYSLPAADGSRTLQEVPEQFGVQRDSDSSILGVVGKVWQPVQNHEGFELIEDFMQGDTAWIEAAGALDGGKKVWVLAHMAEDMQIAGEDIYRYVLFSNGHDGRTSVTAAMTDVRVVCQNTLTFALNEAKRRVNVRHTAKATERLAQAKQILGLRDLYSEELAKQAEWLVSEKISDGAFNMFLEGLMPVPEEQEGKPAETMILKRRDEVRSLYTEADNLNNIRGTKWGALNAVVEYADYWRPFRDDETQAKAQFADVPIKDKARELLLASK